MTFRTPDDGPPCPPFPEFTDFERRALECTAPLFGEKAAIEAIHAGLETSVIGGKYPEMDMISVGPTLLSVHSPDERMEVSTVEPLYQLLVSTLADIPAKE